MSVPFNLTKKTSVENL